MTLENFDPNDMALIDSGIFGLPHTYEDSNIIILPVPFEATTSYGGGTSFAPLAIEHASKQVDLHDAYFGSCYESGIYMLEINSDIVTWNKEAKSQIETALYEENKQQKLEAINNINHYSQLVNDYVYQQTIALLNENKKIGLLGGDHSIPFGAIKALVEKHPNLSILQIDAHLDLRKAYEGFEYSHASIMYNVIHQTPLKKLVQIGIRDFCESEIKIAKQHHDRITTFYDKDLVEAKMTGQSFENICQKIINSLTDEIYISFDIDGLDPRFCPHTGTPVPGGIDYNEISYLLYQIKRSGKKVIAFDLNEVSPGIKFNANKLSNLQPSEEWDALVGARLLYKLCGMLA